MPRTAKSNKRRNAEIESAFNAGEDVLNDFDLGRARFVAPGETFSTASCGAARNENVCPQSYHLVKQGNFWRLSVPGASKESKIFAEMTKAQAMRAAVKFVRSNCGSIKIHRADGSLQEERVYPRSRDPNSPRRSTPKRR